VIEVPGARREERSVRGRPYVIENWRRP
jgi:hypothetical protein